MDSRVRDHARVLVDHATEIERGQTVDVVAPREAADLVVALFELLGERGARPDLHWDFARADAAYARALDPDDAATPAHRLAAMESTDVVIIVEGGGNNAEAAGVPDATRVALDRALEPVEDARESTRWCLTAHPTETAAQEAGMRTGAYEDLVWNAMTLDWDAQDAFQRPLAERMADTDEVRVVAHGTDVSFSIAGSNPLSDTGYYNLPGGEVFTAPDPASATGHVTFTLPATLHGRTVRDARVDFEDGEATVTGAAEGADALRDVLATDDGARYLGEFGVGTNRAITEPTGNVLFDEKMGDTVHFAFGEPIYPNVPDDATPNESVIHEDLVVDLRESGRIEFDGDTVFEDGKFWFEQPESPGDSP